MRYQTPSICELGRVEQLTRGSGAGNVTEGEDLYFYIPWPPWP